MIFCFRCPVYILLMIERSLAPTRNWTTILQSSRLQPNHYNSSTNNPE
jgi:hypothetical protein